MVCQRRGLTLVICAVGLGENKGVHLHVCGPSVPQVLTLLLLDLTLLQGHEHHIHHHGQCRPPQSNKPVVGNSTIPLPSSTTPSSITTRKENAKVVPRREPTKCTGSKLLLLLLLLLLHAMDMNTENLSKQHLLQP